MRYRVNNHVGKKRRRKKNRHKDKDIQTNKHRHKEQNMMRQTTDRKEQILTTKEKINPEKQKILENFQEDQFHESRS